MNTLPPLRRAGALFIATAACLLVCAARADNNWDGDGNTSNWSNANNWFSNTAAPTGSGVDINFSFQNVQWDSTYDYGNFDDFHSIIFNSSLAHYLHLLNPSLRGMDLFGSVVNNSFNGVDFNVDIAFHTQDSHIEANNSQLVFNNGNIYLNGNTIHFLGANYIQVNGAISDGSGSGQIVLDTSFMNLHLNNSGNSYTGQTTINFGTLWNDADNVIPDASALFVGASGVYNKNGKTESVASIFGSGSIVLGSTGNLTYAGNASQEFSGTFSGSAPIVKDGTGTWKLSGNSSSLTSDIFAVGGTLELNNNGAAGTSGTIRLGQTSGSSTATLQIDSGINISRPIDVRSGSSGTKTIQGNAGTGATATLSGTVSLSNPVTLQSIGVGTLALTNTISGAQPVTIGSGNVGKVTLSGANTYTGVTTIDGGILNAASLANGGTSSSIGSSTNVAANLVFGGGTLQYTGSPAPSTDRLFTIGDANGNTATLDASGGIIGTLSFTNGGAIAFGNTSAHTLNLTGINTGINTLSPVVGDNTGATSLTKSGGGTWVLSGANTYTGGTTLSDGLLQLNTNTALGSTSSALTVNSGVLNLNGQTVGVGNLTGSGGNIWNNGPANNITFTIGNGNGTGGNYAGVIADNDGAGSGTVALTKTGTGTITLSGANTYTGATIISNGTLSLDSAGSTTARLANTSNITVNSGGTLLLANSSGTTSNDRIGNSAKATLTGGTFNTGGLSEHGASNNTAGIGALTLQSTSTIDMGNGASIVAFENSNSTLGNSAAWSGTLNIYNWTGTPNTGGGTDELFVGSGLTGLSATQLAELQFFSGAGTGAYTPGAIILSDGEIVPVAVPEPGTWVAGGLALASLAFGQRRRLLAR